MYRVSGVNFGINIEPGPSQTDLNIPVTFQILTGATDDKAAWRGLGPKFPAEHLDDLIKQLQKARKILDTEFVKAPGGYRTRHVFF